MHALDKSNKQIEEQVSRMETKIEESEAVNIAFKENKNITVLYLDALNNSNMNVKLKAFDELSKVLELKMVAHDAFKDARNDLEIELICIVKQVPQFVQQIFELIKQSVQLVGLLQLGLTPVPSASSSRLFEQIQCSLAYICKVYESRTNEFLQLISKLSNQVKQWEEKYSSLDASYTKEEVGDLKFTKEILQFISKMSNQINQLEGKYSTLDVRYTNEVGDLKSKIEAKDQQLEKFEQRFRDYQSDIQELKTCKVCMERDLSVVFLPCRHLCCCNECGTNLSIGDCPMCRVPITSRIQVYQP